MKRSNSAKEVLSHLVLSEDNLISDSTQKEEITSKIISIYDNHNLRLGLRNSMKLFAIDLRIFKGKFINNSIVTFYAHHLIKKSRHLQDFLLIITYLVSILPNTYSTNILYEEW